jgi:putative chitinase
MTPIELTRMMPFAASRADTYAPILTKFMPAYQIDTPKRQAAFLAQVGHETSSLKHMLEIADGSAYEGRADLGNTEPGDGKRFPGRGGLQATGRGMCTKLAKALGVDFVTHPELLEQPEWAISSACWIWTIDKGLNPLADADKFGSITKRINGGYTHIDERIQLWLNIRRQIGL